jgi:D-alanyl-D-alanine-carboxypeptidase/D-alanyl-D-alanine-endopeptidase
MARLSVSSITLGSLITISLASPLPSALAQTTRSSASLPKTSLPNAQSIRTLGSELFLQSGSTGMVLVIVRDDQVIFEGYGETAPGSHLAPNQNAVVRLCSLTKIFTTDVLSKLVADKTVTLNDTLQRFAPRGTTVPNRVRPITLANLATHTSGLPRELGNAPRDTPHFTFPDYRTRWRWLPNQRLLSTPGTAALYSNIAFDLLSDALQSASHQQFAALLAQRTLNPLHMQNTTYFPTARQCSLLLISAHEDGPCTSTEQTAGSSGLYSTAADMTLWLKYLLQTGTPVIAKLATSAPDATMPDASTPHTSAQAVYILPSNLVKQKGLDHAGEPTGIGLGWIHLLPTNSPSHIIEKTGGGAGFSTYIAINHATHTAIFLAATEGPPTPDPPTPDHLTQSPAESPLSLFNATNKLLLAVAGLPPLAPPPPKPARKRKTPHRSRRL